MLLITVGTSTVGSSTQVIFDTVIAKRLRTAIHLHDDPHKPILRPILIHDGRLQ